MFSVPWASEMCHLREHLFFCFDQPPPLLLSILPAESSQNPVPFPSKMAQLAAICKMQLEEQSR